MPRILFCLAFAAAAGSAQAQIKCWNEAGKRVCGDAPPAGAKVTTMSAPASGAAPAAAPKGDAKAAKKGPMTPAEKEQDYKKRQLAAEKDAEKAEAERKQTEARRENCARAQEALRALESGQRITRVDAKGERYYLDDAQIAKETAEARAGVQKLCN
ncbi:MAG: DUF4124 domain-containing protein [Burkholderiales bacterium]|nr:DUF4124 domain-containing protein [Burkholderiales bacterium]